MNAMRQAQQEIASNMPRWMVWLRMNSWTTRKRRPHEPNREREKFTSIRIDRLLNQISLFIRASAAINQNSFSPILICQETEKRNFSNFTDATHHVVTQSTLGVFYIQLVWGHLSVQRALTGCRRLPGCR